MKKYLRIFSLVAAMYMTAAHAQEITGTAPASGQTPVHKLMAPLPPMLQSAPNDKTKTASCTDKNKYADSKLPGRGIAKMTPTSIGWWGAYQKFPGFTGTITGMYFDGFSPNVTNNVNIVIYTIDPSGKPGTLLGGGSINIPQGTNYAEYGGIFPSPITVVDGFFATVDLNINSIDTAVVLFNQNGSGNNKDYSYLGASTGYYSLLYDLTTSFNVDFMLRPIIKFNMTTKFTASETSICPNEQVTFNNYSTVPIFVNDAEFSKLPNSSNYEWNFGDNSPKSNMENPIHVFQPLADPNSDYIVNLTTIFYGYTTDCKITDSVKLDQEALPAAYFAYTSSKLDVTFHNLSKYGQSYKWDFGYSGSTSTLQSPLFSYPAEGTYIVDLMVTNPCSTSTYQAFVKVSKTENYSTLGIEEGEEVSRFEAYPNPISDKLILDLGFHSPLYAGIGIFNILGENVIQLEKQELKEGTVELDVSALKPGTYFVRLETDRNAYIKRVYKQ